MIVFLKIEQYITFNVGHLKFLDSLQFLNCSLDNLVKNLKEDQFINMKKHYKGEQLKLLMKKGVYPYEYMDSFEKFKEKNLPNKEEFYSTLTRTTVSNENYEHAQNVWNEFNIQDLKEYHDLYLKTDVLLLADVFESFRDLSIDFYQLDP